ncbi:SMI1/KNR4 family protein [Pectobacterium parmentieri]|uniref:SMI1/KNR4 family protein n=1 Tax=Pectobacterium parmentieri TaxID=1905730 RepID=UPI000EB08BB8|nr:SMI1/KNR4 family protein [Pectobacterium parmentieri]AYH03384.1 SMI1/KNR4 family protein [Pectobacterium parmentieri]AYH29641.1 SMI1/KNR4 family protein [Pectobacterium parmentieri]AYH34059.1 SMI1/KNR4 family protein [Pectobacterium parmentieri]MBI0518529.1 SMI1/KNR4 family protein [Pectobacterium parmentieri]
MAIKLSIGIDYSDVKDVESKYGIIFPSDYIDFLTKYNGIYIGAGSYCTIPFSKVDDGEIDFQEMYGINTINPSFDLLRANDIRNEVVVLDNPFIIGSDPGGNPFFINCEKSDSAVYYWDRTHIHFDNNFDYQETNEEGNIYKLSDSFYKFYDFIMVNVGGDKKTIKEHL